MKPKWITEEMLNDLEIVWEPSFFERMCGLTMKKKLSEFRQRAQDYINECENNKVRGENILQNIKGEP